MFASRLSVKLLLPAALAAFCAMSSAVQAADQVFVGAFDVGPSGNAQKFNPLTAAAGFGFYNKYFSTLTLYDVSLQKISGDLADSWSYAKDGKSLTLKLRKDVKWHDGKPFTAADVKFTLELIRSPELASVFAPRLADISAIKTPDSNTVVIELSRPDVTLPDAFTSIMIVPRHLLMSVPVAELRNAAWWKSPVGTGPFKWSKYLPDQYVELVANPDYYLGKPKLDKLINRYFKDASAAALALASNEIQFTYLTMDQVRENQASKAFNVISGPSHVLNYLGVNHSDPRFQDVRVRQAILYAIDRPAIVKSIYNNSATIANCALTLPKFQPAKLDKYETNLAKARTLLAAANWDQLSKGQPVELLTYYNDQVSKDVIASLQSMLAQAGINVKPRFVDSPTYGQLVDANRYSMVFAGGGVGPDPSALTPMLHSSYAPPKGVNRMRVKLPQLDALLDAGQLETDDTKRTALYRDACAITNAQLPWIPLWSANRFGGFGKNVQQMIWTPAPAGGRYQEHAELWQLR